MDPRTVVVVGEEVNAPSIEGRDLLVAEAEGEPARWRVCLDELLDGTSGAPNGGYAVYERHLEPVACRQGRALALDPINDDTHIGTVLTVLPENSEGAA